MKKTTDSPLHSGELYDPMEASILDEQLGCLERLYDYNATRPLEQDKRAELLRQMLAEVGENCYIEPPFHANWGGRHVHFGKNVYVNFNLTLVDDTHIYVGDYTMFGPNVTVCTAALSTTMLAKVMEMVMSELNACGRLWLIT